MTIAILGRQANLSLAEIESVFGADKIADYTGRICLIKDDVDINNFGGIIKIGQIHDECDSFESALESIKSYYSSAHIEGKHNLGVSLYGFKSKNLHKKLLGLKKEIKQFGISSRIVNGPKDVEISSAQMIHNHLDEAKGNDWIIAKIDSTYHLAIATHVQDIESYTKRDRTRPARDAKVGMLPPKLAQILINLAVQENQKSKILDPFCGTGVLLQEAILRGHSVIGTDIEERMIDYSEQNLQWLKDEYSTWAEYKLEVGDATSHQWSDFNFVACETYLGPPLFKKLNEKTLEPIVEESNNLHEKFFKNLARQTKKGTRIAVAVPAWRSDRGKIIRLPLIDDLPKLGYNLVDFKVAKQPLLYFREDQFVARDIIVAIRN